jgi:hypothetical protein
VYPFELPADSAGKWGAVSKEWTAETAAPSAGIAEQNVGTATAQCSHLILHSGNVCSIVG